MGSSDDACKAKMKLFITGGTGYIGGEVLYQFLREFPGIQVNALYRHQGEDKIIRSQDGGYDIRCIHGTLDDEDIVRRECENADIIINAADYNHPASVQVIKDVLSKKQRDTLFLQIGGTGILVDNEDPEKVYHDVSDIDEINSLPDKQPHRKADKIVLSIEENNPEFIKTAIICPPLIFGLGQGCDNRLSVQIPFMVRWFIELGHGFTVNDGKYRWDHSHVFDVGSLFIKIVERYLNKEPFYSGYNGYYFVEDGEDFYWDELTRRVVNALYSRGLIKSQEISQVTPAQFKSQYGISSLYWGSNCRSKGEAGRKIGWIPVKSNDECFWRDVEDCIDYMVKHGG